MTMFFRTLLFTSVMMAGLYAEMINAVAVLVRDEPITLYDIEQAKAEYQTGTKNSVEMLIRKKLEQQEAKERGIKVSKQDVYDDIETIARRNNMSVTEFFDMLYQTRKMTQSAFKEQIEEKLLNQKLYNAIAFSHMETPSDEAIEEYYQLHRSEFSHASRFRLQVYSSPSAEQLGEKLRNPMIYAPQVAIEEQVLDFDTINPKLAELLEATPVNTFTEIIPMQGQYVSFYLQEKVDEAVKPLSELHEMISNAIMGEKREQVLNDYFARLRVNADIKMLRVAE